jgi:dTDP-4-dehydrorhamnose reductase
MLGRYVSQLLDVKGVEWIGSDLDVDISDRRKVSEFVSERRLSAIINCAAYTAVDAAETDEGNAMRVNGEGPAVLAEIARLHGARFVHVSTDYVFDGERLGEHEEQSPVGPSNVYGKTKLAGELGICRVFDDKTSGQGAAPWFVVRTSWLFGPGRSSFVDTMWKLMQEKSELRVVCDQMGRPTFARDLARFLVDLASEDAPIVLSSGTWHFANLTATSWFEFAKEIRECMLRCGVPVAVERIHPVSSEEFPRPAKRPKNSVLSTRKLEAHGVVPRDWRLALAEYIQERVGQ